MKTAIITLGDINGSSQNLPDRKIIKEAQRNMCMSAAFWARIKSGRFPYVFNKEENKLMEANYSEVTASLKKEKGDSDAISLNSKEVYWITDEDLPKVSSTMKKISDIEKLKLQYKDELKSFT